MQSWFVVFLFCLMLCEHNITGTEIFKENRELFSHGEEKFKELQKLTLSPYGSCWTSVISRMKNACPLLTEETHSRLAFGFSNCFMQQLGFESERCDDEEAISLCLDRVKFDTRWFAAYLQYHTHTHNMCYFLNHQLWLQKTEMTIQRLTVSSDDIGKRLEETSSKQLELIRLQSDSVHTQKTLLEQSQVLNLYLENSRSSMIEIFDEFKRSAEGQQTLVMDMLNKLSSWIQFLVDHVTSIYTVAFYFLISCVMFIVTATPRTCRARVWLVFLWMFIFLSEFKIKVDYHVLWYMRYAGLLASLLLLLYFGIMFRDYETLNNKLLNELYHMVLTQVQQPPFYQELRALLGAQRNIVPSFDLSSRIQYPSTSIKEIHEDDSSSDLSSDATFVCDSDAESEESSISFCSFSTSSGSTSPSTSVSHDNSLVALQDLANHNSTFGPLTPVSAEDMSCRYNLRPRRSLGSSAINNSFVLKESPRSFGKLVKIQENNSKLQSFLQTHDFYKTST